MAATLAAGLFFILLVLRLKRRIQKIILNTLIPLSVAQTTGIHFPAHVILRYDTDQPCDGCSRLALLF